MMPTSTTAIFHKANMSKELGRQPIVQTGGILGGGSSVNLMLYTRGQRSDYDSWNMPGWSTDELMPYFQKLETYHGRGHKAIHGYEGPLQITRGPFLATNSEDDFIRSCEKQGIPKKPDMQDFDTANGTERWMRTVSTDGKRQDAAHTYIHPLLADGKHPNLHVLCQKKVVRVLFDGKRACGVEFIPNPQYQPTESFAPAQPAPQVVRARKQVVLSAGALGTPPILERSGIGSKAVLEKAGVPLLVDLPGVGHDYQDHHLCFWAYRTDLAPNETLDGLWSGRYPAEKAFAKKDPILGWNACDVSAKVRPSESELAKLSSKFQTLWKRDWSQVPDRPVVIFTLVSAFTGDPSLVEPGQYASIASYTTYPYSRGHIHITGSNWQDDLDFDAGFFSGENGDFDIQQHIWAYKKQREILRRTSLYRGELEFGHPKFPENSTAKAVNLSGQPKSLSQAGDVTDLVYTGEDDAAIEQHLRENIATTWHSLGTAKLAPRDKMGVVDEDLDVYGVDGLKVADLSIVPKNVAANTNNTALMIGEKCASLILEELGLKAGAVAM
jgi:alcohol oxidase